ncbi:hypothetical protein BGZ82_000707 [Podila clonocystis]|nr:hypothetical protein BGZ82_000707 [Podila clonocystis]
MSDSRKKTALVLIADGTEEMEAVITIVPGGGPGAQAMVASPLVHEWVQAHYKKTLLAAVCAGPTVLKAANVARGAKVTSHPSVRTELEGYFDYQDNNVGKSIVVQDTDHGLITSRGPGSTFEFALAIVERLQGAKTVDEIRGPMMFPH